MKTNFIVLICAAMMLAACCGGNQSSSSCSKQDGDKACCQVTASADGKTCCSAATCTEGKACCKTAEVKKIISAQVFIKPEKVDAFLAATKDLIEKSRAEEGCISYSLYQDPHDKTKFLFFEEWKNQAAVDFHFSTDHFVNFGATLEDCASAPAVITIFDSIAEEKVG